MNPGGLHGKARPEKFPDVNDYRNPIIAQALKVMGYENMFNRGISRVKSMMIENGGKEPTSNVDKITAFEVTSYSAIEYADLQEGNKGSSKIAPSIPQVTAQVKRLLLNINGEMDRESLQQSLDISHREYFRSSFLVPALEAELIKSTIPDKPNSSKQKYRLIPKGIVVRNKLIEKKS